jgi:hypothetical protein
MEAMPMSDDPRLADVRPRLLRPASVEDVRETLAVLDEISASPESAKDAEEGLRRAFECIRELTAADPDTAVEVLVHDLLPRCLAPDAGDDHGYGFRHCYTFGEWLGDLPEEHRHRVRSVALPQALGALEGKGVRNAIRLVSCIGHWDKNVLAALDRVVQEHDDETGDHAMSARASLRPELEPAHRALLLAKLHRRILAGPNLHQIICCRVIGTQETAEMIWRHWLAAPAEQDSERSMLATFAWSLLAEIAARERDSSFTARVWNWLVELSRRPAKAIEGVFAPNNSLVNLLDIPAAVPELVHLAVHSEPRHRYLYYLRVLECRRPAHMAGWDAVPLADLAAIRVDAVEATGMKDRYSTSELHRKEAAWDVLLCRGEPSALPSIGDAIVGEKGYVTHQFLELAACLRLEPLPGFVSDLLGGTPVPKWDEHERLVAQIGAIQAAHGAGTREAFDALLGYRKLGEGVLLSLVEAIAETARLLLKENDRSPVERLLHAAETSLQENSRGAAAAALAAILEEGDLTAAEISRVAALLSRPTTDPHARRAMLFSLAARPATEVPPAATDYAKGVLASPATAEKHDSRPAALALFARQPAARSDPEFLARHCGLTEHGGAAVPSPLTLIGVVPHVVGRYFVAEPERFGPVVASLLQNGDAGVLANLLPSVREVGTNSPAVVLDALVARLRGFDTGRVAEPPLLRTLAAVAPSRLLAPAYPNLAAWLPQARADLADTLGQLGSLREGEANARFTLLTRLAGDGIYAVRRAAYRAAANCDLDRFIRLAQGWAAWQEPGRHGPRRYAAECAGWMLPKCAAEVFAPLGWDQEPAVRKAYGQSLKEHEDRLSAHEFAERVLAVRDPVDVVRAWRHGIGLALVGDDSTIRLLADRLGDGLPPSVRFWLKRVRKAVERRWGEAMRKWPEPWYARPGQLEQFSGTLRGDNGKETGLSGTLWLMPAETPSERASWGGWGKTEKMWSHRGELITLIIPGRGPANILMNSALFPAQELQFLGSGPYPGPV